MLLFGDTAGLPESVWLFSLNPQWWWYFLAPSAICFDWLRSLISPEARLKLITTVNQETYSKSFYNLNTCKAFKLRSCILYKDVHFIYLKVCETSSAQVSYSFILNLKFLYFCTRKVILLKAASGKIFPNSILNHNELRRRTGSLYCLA